MRPARPRLLHALAGRAQRGFTLVEVLVALAIMAVLAAMSWQGIDAMIRAKAINQENMERTLRLATVLSQWEQDLLQVHDQPGTPPLLYDGASLRLVRRTPEGVQVVVWALRDGLLQRWASASVTDAGLLREQWLRSLQLLGNEAQQLRVLDNLASMQVYFWRDGDASWSNAQSSGSTGSNAPNVTVQTVPAPTGAGAGAGGAAPSVTAPKSSLPEGVRVIWTFAGASDAQKLTRDIQMSPQWRQ
jgi:general secretion pathway protein J